MHLQTSVSEFTNASQASPILADRDITSIPTPTTDGVSVGSRPAQKSALRILLAEDNEDLRSVARTFLQAEGYEVIACADGGRAIGILKSGIELDLLLTDIEMPNATGIEVAAVAAALYPRLPIMVMSGAVLMEATLREIRAAGWGFFAKPFPLPDLLTSVHERLRAIGHAGSPLSSF